MEDKELVYEFTVVFIGNITKCFTMVNDQSFSLSDTNLVIHTIDGGDINLTRANILYTHGRMVRKGA